MTPRTDRSVIARLQTEAAGMATTPYLIFVTVEMKPHCSVVRPEWDAAAQQVIVALPSRWGESQEAGLREITLLWPPSVPGGYSLIVDGTASSETGDSGAVLAVTPTRAVLHRPDRAVTPGSSCEADCIQIIPS